MDGRRKSRTQVSLLARYRSPTVFEFVEEQCFDLSEGGMFIRSKAPAPAGTLLKIECQVGDGPDQIAAVARVVWLRDADSSDGPRGMGVKFVKLENASHDVIAGVLSRASLSTSLPPPPPASVPPQANKPSAPPPASVPPQAVAAQASATPAEQPLASAPPATTETQGKLGKGKKAKGKKGKEKEKDKQASTSAAVSATLSTPTPEAKQPEAKQPGAKQSPSPVSQPSQPVANPTSSPVNKAIVFAVLAIAAIVVLATRSKPEPVEPPIEQEPTAAADEPSVTAPAEPVAPVAPVEPTIAAAPEPAPVPEPVAPVEPAITAAPEPAPVPEPVVAPAVIPEPAVAPVANTAPTTGLSYVVNVVTTPRGAVVTADDQTCNAPCALRFSDLSTLIKINATKPRHHPTATTIDAQAGFTERDGALHKTLYLKLHPDASAAGATSTNDDAPAAEPAPAAAAPEPQ